MWQLLKIIVDDPGKAGDGSDAKKHTETIFTGDEQDIRAFLAEENIVWQHTVANVTMSYLKQIVADHGYILREKDGEN
jgi:hypothetical protein